METETEAAGATVRNGPMGIIFGTRVNIAGRTVSWSARSTPVSHVQNKKIDTRWDQREITSCEVACTENLVSDRGGRRLR